MVRKRHWLTVHGLGFYAQEGDQCFLWLLICRRESSTSPLPFSMSRRDSLVIKPSVLYSSSILYSDSLWFITGHLLPRATLRELNVIIWHNSVLQERPCLWPLQIRSCWGSLPRVALLPGDSILFTKVWTPSCLMKRMVLRNKGIICLWWSDF